MALYTGGRKPPNPDPGNYVWIKTKDGAYWRLKRGTLKKAKMNDAYSEGIERMKLSAPCGKTHHGQTTALYKSPLPRAFECTHIRTAEKIFARKRANGYSLLKGT